MQTTKQIELTENQKHILDRLCEICGEFGGFEFDDLCTLKEYGLSRVDVMAEIVALRKLGYNIRQNRTNLFSGVSFYTWCWNNFERQAPAYKAERIALSENLNSFFAAVVVVAGEKAIEEAEARILDQVAPEFQAAYESGREDGRAFSATFGHMEYATSEEMWYAAATSHNKHIEMDRKAYCAGFCDGYHGYPFGFAWRSLTEVPKNAPQSGEGLASFFAAATTVAEQMVIDQVAQSAAAATKPAKAKRELQYEQIIDRWQVSERYEVVSVLSSNGVDRYEVTVADGRATGCTCPSRLRCYHMDGVEFWGYFEAWWNAPLTDAEQIAEGELISEVVLGEDAVQHIADDLVAFQIRLAAEVAACESARERRMAAPLNNNSGFRLMA